MEKVIIYSTPTCTYCKMAKEYFNSHNIEYKDIDVAIDQTAADLMIKKSGQMGVPVIIINKNGKEHIIAGFNQKEISDILEV